MNAALGDGLNNGKFAIYVSGREDVRIRNEAVFAGVLYAPDSYLEFTGRGELFGAFIGRSAAAAGTAETASSPRVTVSSLFMAPFLPILNCSTCRAE